MSVQMSVWRYGYMILTKNNTQAKYQNGSEAHFKLMRLRMSFL